MNWRQRVFDNFKLYAVTDIKKRSTAVITAIEQALRGGADIVQLRSKALSDKEFFEIGKEVRKITRHYKKLFFINNRPDLADILEADGIHLGQDDVPISVVRQFFSLRGKNIFIGKSTHSLMQAHAAERDGADYIGVGPIFATPTKKSYRPVGLELIKKVKRNIAVPFVCIGGINRATVEDVLAAGAERVAVVRAIFSARNVEKAARSLKEIIHQHGK
ncbi:MAG: thiamine phosphate synthase [Candidatus Omnitrophica bacterium]|nr:thiamine phosphate synthase [Candidatus Omnitrophota bacterium]